MAGLNPLALEFYPCLGSISSSSSFVFPYPSDYPSDCFYTPPSPFLPLLPNYPLPFSGTIESSYLSLPPLSVYSNSLHLYLDFPSPLKVPDLISYSPLCGLPVGVLEEEGKVVTGEEVLQNLRRRSETKNRANRFSRRRREEYSFRPEKELWVAKGRGRVVLEAARKEVMKSPSHEAVQVIDGESKSKTTLMVRNIPNKFTLKMLLDFLDGHCREEASSAYDFVYLPTDFGSGCNLGYAFVNFTDSTATAKLHRALHRKKWDVLGSKKICEINFAKIQGVEALQRHFEKSIFACESDEYLPVRFFPFRDGVSPFESRMVGTRVPRVPVLSAD